MPNSSIIIQMEKKCKRILSSWDCIGNKYLETEFYFWELCCIFKFYLFICCLVGLFCYFLCLCSSLPWLFNSLSASASPSYFSSQWISEIPSQFSLLCLHPPGHWTVSDWSCQCRIANQRLARPCFVVWEWSWEEKHSFLPASTWNPNTTGTRW